MESIREYLVEQIFIWKLLAAARYPLYLTALAMPLAVVFGLVLAAMRRAKTRFLSWPAVFYVEVVRGTPLLVQIFLVYFALPKLGHLLFNSDILTIGPFPCGVLCLAGNYAAYESEILRAGLDAVDKGQREAALSLGMSERQAFGYVILPQAFRIVIPPIVNDMVAMLKDTCLVSAIGVRELLKTAENIGREKANLSEMYMAASILYMLLSLGCYFLGKWVEKKLKAKGGQELPAGKFEH
ncbi:MAG: amino acid ABC transporter permease [Planctomycetota bacterium]|nr:amino acid ABC transporter permease [Planctomycetota bacterium]